MPSLRRIGAGVLLLWPAACAVAVDGEVSAGPDALKAWELAARVSHVDLNDFGITGGRLTMLMTGVNWHLHPHVKWCFNYGCGQVSGRKPDGCLNIFQTRIELDF